MRHSALLTLLVSLALTSAQGQVKKGGLFGFGSDDDQISADLFPNSPSSSPAPQSAPTMSSSPDRGDEDGIFRTGEPADIDAVSYVIENGERVEKKVEKKKKSFFSFGKKTEAVVTDSIPSIPAPSYPQPRNVIPVDAPPVTQATTAVETVVEEAEETSDAVLEAVNAPPVEERKKSSGLFSFFGKKSEDIPDAPAFAMPDEVVVVQEAEEVADAAPVAVAPAASPNPYQPVAAPTNTTAVPAPVVADPAPEFASVEPQVKPEKEGFSLPNPLAKIRSQKPEKTIDLTGAETIIQNGEIVEAAEDIVESNMVETGDGVRQPPRIVDGVTTYSSWDDIDARSVSAADKILNQIR